MSCSSCDAIWLSQNSIVEVGECERLEEELLNVKKPTAAAPDFEESTVKESVLANDRGRTAHEVRVVLLVVGVPIRSSRFESCPSPWYWHSRV